MVHLSTRALGCSETDTERHSQVTIELPTKSIAETKEATRLCGGAGYWNYLVRKNDSR
jgi:hypothetical protein